MKQRHMLRSFFYIFCLLVFSGTLGAQSAQLHRQPGKPVLRPGMLKAVPASGLSTGVEAIAGEAAVPPSKSMLRAYSEEIAGQTTYDLQSNGSESPRISPLPNGDIGATWMISIKDDDGAWADRGTGYNRRSTWTSGSTPTERIESSFRTGFPNYLIATDGSEIIVNHRADALLAGTYRLHTLRRGPAGGNWTEADVPTSAPKGQLWSKAAIDGNTIHVIAVTTPISLSGVLYKGMDSHLLYYRSKDAGLTWEVKDAVIPGLDSSAFYSIGPDRYCIDARNGVVAVGVFDGFNDSKIFKSNDGGDTWDAPFTIVDFPLTKYKIDQGYTVDDIGGADPNAPSPLSIFTVDGAGSVVIDPLGYVHAFVGEMYVLDSVLTDKNFTYYPGINGMIYWNETTPDQALEVTYSRDWNGNDTLDITGPSIVGYNTGLSSMPSAAVDDAANLYLAYSANVENLYDDLGANYRHIYTMKSSDYGQTWSDPVDVLYKAGEGGDSLLASLSEAVWPSAYKRVQDKFHVLFQRDFIPGSSVQQADVQNGASEMVYIANADIVGTQAPVVPQLELSAVPNPATTHTQIAFDLARGGATRVDLLNSAGELVRHLVQGDLSAGQHLTDLNTASLPNGLYFVRVQSGGQSGVKKVAVLKK